MSECSICGEESERASFGKQVCSDCLDASSAPPSALTLPGAVKSMSERKPVEMKTPRAENHVTVFSRQYRSKACRYSGTQDLVFDDTGHALIPEVCLPALQEFMRGKPGRIRIVKETPAEVEVEVEVLVCIEPEEGVAVEIVVGAEPEEGVKFDVVEGEEPQPEPQAPNKNKGKNKSSKKNK